MADLLNQLGISGIGALACLVAAFLFRVLAKQVKESTTECREDRKELRCEIKKLKDDQTKLEVRTAKAEILANIPCDIAECPKRD